MPLPPLYGCHGGCTECTLLKILEALTKEPQNTYIPYPMYPFYGHEEPKREVRYVPVPETKKVEPDDEYKIDPYWMEEITRVVDIAYNEGYYVILNSHHDVRGLDDKTHPPMSTPLKYHEGYILRDNQADIEESKRFLKAVWTQICQAFNCSYGERLIFETMNEQEILEMDIGV